MTNPLPAPRRRLPRGIALATIMLMAPVELFAAAAPAATRETITAPTPLAPEQQAATLAAIDASIAAGRFGAASAMIGRALPSDPSPELQLRLAELALASGDIPGAVVQFTDLGGQPAVSARAQQGLGLARLRQGNLPAATAAIDVALASDPGLSRAWNARGVIADQRRDWATADAAYTEAITRDPQSVQARTNRGYSRILRGQYAEAEADLVAALAQDPKSATTQTNLRFARAMQGRYREAFAGSTRETLAADLNTVGFAAMVRGDHDSAETYFSRAMALNTRFDHVAWANLEYMKLNGRVPMDASEAGLAAADAEIHHPAKRRR
jgi:Flp pilus assembly protein TadD